MTTCTECLTALSSARLDDIIPGSAIAVHCYTCPDCNCAAEEVRYAEYRLAASLSEQRPITSPVELAANALRGSEGLRRRRIARWIRGGLAIVGVVLFAAAMEAITEREAPKKDLRIETLELKCLSPQVATELATPYLRSSGSAIYRSDGAHAITLRGKTDEVVGAMLQVRNFDSPRMCTLPGVTPVSPAISGGIPGKD